MPKFNVGDRVIIVGGSCDEGIIGKTATVVGSFHDSYMVTVDVKIDNWHGGHCGSMGTASEKGVSLNHDRWYVYENEIRLAEDTDDFLDSVLGEQPLLPTDPASRKKIPLGSGVFDYFTAALIEIAKVSFEGNQQHNSGEPLHWAQDKSTDHADTLLRHFAERGSRDTDGQRHSAKVAWRALALLQMELQNDGYPKARGAR